MPKIIEPLTDTKIRNAKPKDKDYQLRDGEGLYILIKKSGKKIFRIDYSYMGKRNTYTIGEHPQITLSKARKIKAEIKELKNQGIDPNKYKLEQIRKKQLEQNKNTVKEVSKQFLNYKRKDISTRRFINSYQSKFQNYIIPQIGDIKIDEVTKHDIIRVIKNTYNTKLEKDRRGGKGTQKAKEIFDRLKMLFKYAIHNGYTENNPALQVDLYQIIPKHKIEHLKAITDGLQVKQLYKDILSIKNPLISLPLQYIALTAVRPENVSNLRWEYIDFDNRVIIYPAGTMKRKESEFRTPITDGVMQILEAIKPYSFHLEGYVFPSVMKHLDPVKKDTLYKALKRLEYKGEQTLHGFRSSFRTITAEHQRDHGISSEAIEAQQHHTIGNNVTQSYLRSDFLEERRELMQWWEKFLKN